MLAEQVRSIVKMGSTLQASVINLLNTIVGAGLLALPLAFRADGVLLGLVIVLLAGVTSGFGLYLQGLSSKFIRRGDANFFNICSVTYPSLSLVFDIAIAIQCFGVGLSYIVLIGDLMPSIVSLPLSNERLFWILSSLVVIIPLVLLKNLDSLKYTSAIALLAIGYMIVLIYSHFFLELKMELIDGVKSDLKGDISVWKPQSLTSILSTFSIIVFAYTGHQNMYSIINELEINSLQQINKISFITIPITAVLFITIGLAGYYTFGDNVGGNIILLYNDDIFTKFGRFSIVLMVLLSFPLMFHPCRISINNITFWISNKFSNTTTTEIEPLLSQDLQPQRPSMTNRKFYILTVCLLIVSYTLAIALSSFEFILSIVGATGSTAISFILPGLFGYKLIASQESKEILKLIDENDHFEQDQDLKSVESIFNNRTIKIFSLGLTVWGIIVMILCLYSSIYLS